MTAAITLVSHACVLIELGEVCVLTDPWTQGTAFNDSWRLLTAPMDLAAVLPRVTHLWISHEHPDHFHVPSLRALPPEFRARVQLLFQRSSDSPKMVAAFETLGFRNVTLLDHRRFTPLGNGVEAYCYHSRQIDSALALRGHGKTMLDLNDVEASPRDLRTLRGDLGAVDVLLNQFSIAGFGGIEAELPALARRILDTIVRDHIALGAATTIPFASFIYFACDDNAALNRFINTPLDVAQRFARERLALTVLAPGERWIVGLPHDNTRALGHYASAYADIGRELPAPAPTVPWGKLIAAFHEQQARLRAIHGPLGLRLLRSFTVRVPDLDRTVSFDFSAATALETPDAPPHLVIASQPLHFMFAHPFGLQTLGVSGRYRLFGGERNWLMHRILFSAMNAGVGLAPRQLVNGRQLGWLTGRGLDLAGQLAYRLSHARAG